MCVRLPFLCSGEEAAALLTDCGYAFINKPVLQFHLHVCQSLISLLPPSTPLCYSTTTICIILICSTNTFTHLVNSSSALRVQLCYAATYLLFISICCDGLHASQTCYRVFFIPNMWKWSSLPFWGWFSDLWLFVLNTRRQMSALRYWFFMIDQVYYKHTLTSNYLSLRSDTNKDNYYLFFLLSLLNFVHQQWVNKTEDDSRYN